MKKYRHVIFDADHTLVDFNEDEKRSFRAAFQNTPLQREDTVEAMWEFSYRNWEELGLNRVNDEEIRKRYHALYYVHIHALFDHAEHKYGLKNADEAEKIFYRSLCAPSHEREGALETVRTLSKKYCVSVATNGLSEMQHARLFDFKPCLFRLFISEEMNCIKPSEEYGEYLLKEIDARADECLFVGDSLTSDIALANRLGMDCVWYASKERALPEGFRITARVSSLKELLNLL